MPPDSVASLNTHDTPTLPPTVAATNERFGNRCRSSWRAPPMSLMAANRRPRAHSNRPAMSPARHLSPAEMHREQNLPP